MRTTREINEGEFIYCSFVFSFWFLFRFAFEDMIEKERVKLLGGIVLSRRKEPVRIKLQEFHDWVLA